ncbi:glycosyltransferase family 4 protein [Flavobacterium sp. ACN6]|uniref:glycosyltransferase family 4 protein n=1 Tax=Flavobacterium sp. ACN6 TaxID=1920426 RepID=UPI000BB2F15E|nr:glycosyltransferase family 4 protein [Flavobacterium sp. ACN6]PBJ06119.1 Spore coat protein SA [Flavobacterium sp. ACN6]
MKEKKIVGFLTATDPTDKRSWSGIHYRMYKSLLNEFDEVYLFGPIPKSKALKKTLQILEKIHLKLFSKKYNVFHNIILSKFYAYKINAQLKKKKIDILFAPAASTEIAFLKTGAPICYLSDTSFGQINGYYESFSGLSPLSVKESNLIEKKAIKNSTTQVYSSNWAADYVINNYKANSKNIYTVSFGANIDSIPAEKTIKKDFTGTVNFLFLGVDWKRKGGDIVLEAFTILINKGYAVTLTICGCTPPDQITNPKINIIPFLNKNNAEEYNEFLKILSQTHLLFVPTRADCTPIVFCEANAFGIPVITTNTGGVSSIIENHINGFALPFESKPIEYADQIETLLNDRTKLKELSLQSRQKFDKELNWNSWGQKMREILLLTIDQKKLF